MSFRPAYRGLLAALLAVLTTAGASAQTGVQHTVALSLAPETGGLSVAHRIEAGSELEILLPSRMTVKSVSVNGEAQSGSITGPALTVGSGADGAVRVELRYAAEPWPGTADGGPFVDARGAYLPAYGGWLAQVEGAGPQAFRLSVDVPLPYRAAVTGRLVDETETDGLYRAQFETETPLDPPSVFAGRFVISERIHRGIRLRTYFSAERDPLAEGYLDAAAEHIDRLSQRIGDYPFSGFFMVSAPVPVGLGFPGLTYVSERILPLPFMRGRSLAHEIAHNWWGNGVGVDYRSGNWAEGLTTFVADYGLAEAAGPEQAWRMRLDWLRDFAALPPERDIPLRRFTHKAHDAAQVIGYGKAAFLFVMLRDRLGAERFDAGLRAFWRDHKFQVASWDDLRQAFEAASGEDLQAFFSQWLDRAGAPTLGIAAAQAGEGAAIRVSQDGPHYDLSVRVRVATEAGERPLTVALAGATQTVPLQTAPQPLSASLDDRHRLFRRLAPGEAPPIMRDVTLDRTSVAVIAVGGDAAAAAAAEALAGRLIDRGAGGSGDPADRPVLLVGLDGHLEEALAALAAGSVPDAVAGRGSARAWTVRRPNGTAVLVVAARDAAALQAVLRPLPHYRRHSYLVFEGRRATDRGIWPADSSALTVAFP